MLHTDDLAPARVLLLLACFVRRLCFSTGRQKFSRTQSPTRPCGAIAALPESAPAGRARSARRGRSRGGRGMASSEPGIHQDGADNPSVAVSEAISSN
mmetsp:Transcript_122805/g.358423  ORF Transcript_122805/g.358423 Transcript_122805/m.358423 type:complete len:98 (+) Transcript_122805:538-831(+)